ncbi:HAMP domain-containing sensor histidine kinase [Fusibacter sp. 3D3]|uniref:sensor histidine kinase n=1 Tax=Fusibacter sp. 3D3 TaxID=1048380 RepID=UPI0008535A17|nr:sensor histidine kinase [Fusibacter sp. 3D3]GAU78139.1 sensor histidine kinase [Fusibacter sp. 3D3]
MFKNYFKYRKTWFILQFIIAITISSVFMLDPFMKLTLSSIIYINGLILFWSVLFFIWDFQKFKSNLNWLDHFDFDPPSTLDPVTRKAILRMQETTRQKDDDITKHQLEQLKFRDFINSWVHGIKTPLSAAKMLLETLPYDTAHQNLNKEIDSIEYYINQTLFYARLESFSDDYHIKSHALNDIFNRAFKQFKSAFILKSLKIDLNIEDLNVLTDDKWLKFILDQLISNAIKYADHHSKLTIKTECTNPFCILKIQNQGVGIAPSDLNRVFKRGFTGSNVRSQNQSTGMGLYLAKKSCEKLGHDLWLTSEANLTTATLRFKRPSDYYDVSLFKA